jgi:hypothetical protein
MLRARQTLRATSVFSMAFSPGHASLLLVLLDFQIINGQEVGGNVASYFCLWDGSVIHAVPGKVGADNLLSEARWAFEIRKSALALATDLGTDHFNIMRYREKTMWAHAERYHAEGDSWSGNRYAPVAMSLPHDRSQQAQVDWLLARNPLAELEMVYPYVWTLILWEKLSDVPAVVR